MCVVFACPEDGKLPTMDELLGGALANSDGAGVAWATEGKLLWRKGLKHAEVEKLIEEGVLKPPCIIHYRITSAGETCDELTHPFPCTPQVQLELEGESTSFPVLFHNGTVSHWREEMKLAITGGRGALKVPPGEWSDTRVLAYLVALYGIGYLEFVDGLSGDKVSLLHPNGVIQYIGNWHHKDGFYASNESYLTGRRGKGGVSGFTRPVEAVASTGAQGTTTPEKTTTPAPGIDLSGVHSRGELQALVKEMHGKSLLLGVEVRS